MVSFTYTIQSAQGLHARPVVEIARVASTCKSSVTIVCGDASSDGADMMGLMALNARRDDVLAITVDGPDEQSAAEALRAVFTF